MYTGLYNMAAMASEVVSPPVFANHDWPTKEAGKREEKRKTHHLAFESEPIRDFVRDHR